jgi:hypothetical protein
VHKEFWDAVNFRRGANPPREEWKAPPQRPPEETEAAFDRFAQYIDYVRSLPNVRFVTAGDLPEIYPDTLRADGASESDLDAITAGLLAGAASGIDFQVIGPHGFSLADQFEVLTRAMARLSAGEKLQFPLQSKGLLGPDSPPPSGGTTSRLSWPGFRDTARDVLDFLETQGRVPSRVFAGADAVAPADFLIALAAAYQSYRTNGRLPLDEGVTLGNQPEVLPARHVAADTPDLFGDWIIHKEGFRAPKILEQARLQAWTLKPALASQ